VAARRIAVVAPEPPTWLDDVLEDDDVAVRVFPLWPAIRRAASVWASGRDDRTIATRFTLGAQLDRLAAQWLSPDAEVVYAPSFCARRTFAEARKRRGPRVVCHLVEDVPDLRQLNADLDIAAAAHPDAPSLRRYRATPRQIAAQESERESADVVHVRSRFVQDLQLRADLASGHVRTFGDPPVVAPRRHVDTNAPTILLAGSATARAGTYEAVHALDALSSATLLVKVGDALEPGDLLAHPRVRAIDAVGGPFERIDAVIAPSWTEVHLPELPHAAFRGIPIVATSRAAGVIDLDQAGASVEPGDADGLVSAVQKVLAAY
jgi:hypothetical protein